MENLPLTEIVAHVSLGPKGLKIKSEVHGLGGGGKLRRKKVGGKRGQVMGFSREARLRMIAETIYLPDAGKSLFLTLTLGKEIQSVDDTKKIINVWKQRLHDKTPWISGLWKIEMQARGQAHLHCLLFNSRERDDPGLEWLKIQAKIDYCGSDPLDGVVYGSNTQILESHRGVSFYIAKYCCKNDEENCWTGRAWGWINKHGGVRQEGKVEIRWKDLMESMRKLPIEEVDIQEIMEYPLHWVDSPVMESVKDAMERGKWISREPEELNCVCSGIRPTAISSTWVARSQSDLTPGSLFPSTELPLRSRGKSRTGNTASSSGCPGYSDASGWKGDGEKWTRRA